jgi:serine/threonine-protein kinase
MDARLLSGTEGARLPYFSPDGKWIAFSSTSDSKIKKIATGGGAPVTLVDANDLTGMFYWNADETIAYGISGKGIMRVPANGGTPEQIIKAAENDPTFSEPQILPDGESVLFTSGGLNTQNKVMLQSLKSGERKELFEGSMAKYLPTGHIVYGLVNSLFAVRFDVKALKVIGGPVSVVEGVSRDFEYQYAVSDSGTLVYVPGPAIGLSSVGSPTTPSNQRTLVWVDRKGEEELISAAPNVCFVPKISPDGTKVAMTISSGGKSDIWIYDIVRESMTRLTFNECSDGPLWSVDGKRVAFWSGSIPDIAVYWKAADGTGTDEKIGSLPRRGLTPWSWSKDGKALITGELTPGVRSNIGALSMEGEHEYKPVLEDNYDEGQSQISPDGQWIAYSSDESGKYEIFVRPFPEVNNGRWQISTAGGDTPLWSPNGRELFYRNGDAVMAVAVETEPVFKAEKPETLFQGAYIPFGFSMQDASTWDISRDGKRFLMMKEATTAGMATAAEYPREINIVVNWFEELKQRAPVD